MVISLLAISGSLRAQSTNTRLLESASSIAASIVDIDVEFTLYDGVEQLPQFNPDKENELDSQTKNWINLARKADALIIASPEYAHGIPGALKNALDWLVSTDAFIEKPFCNYHACPRSLVAPQALLEVLRTMSGVHVVDSDVTVDLERNYQASDLLLSEANNVNKIKSSIVNLCQHIEEQKI